MIDLHCSLPGPAYFYRPSGQILQHCKLISVGPGSAYVPTATYQALMLMIHDQFQDYDYWVGGIDVRHLVDLRDMAKSPEGIDWDLLATFAPSNLAKNAFESQLVALAALLDVDVPISMRSRLVPQLQFMRRLVQARFPITRWFLLAAIALDYANYRTGLGAEYQSKAQPAERGRRIPRSDTVRFILQRAGSHRIGKV